MADYVSIANLVLARIGEGEIRTPDDDVHTARTIASAWDTVRQDCIREHSWNFATARKGLTAEAVPDVPWPWKYTHRLPADSLRLIEVLNLPRAGYQVEGQSLLCDSLGPVYIRYLRDEAEPALWDASFTAYFAARLEATVGVRIAGSNYDVARGERHARAALSRAVRADGHENPPEASDLTGWELARMTGVSPENLDGW